MSTATALRVHGNIYKPEEMDAHDKISWAETAAKLLVLGAAEIDRLHIRDQTHVETIKTLAGLLARSPQGSAGS